MKKKKDIEMYSPWVYWSNSVRELFKLDPELRLTWSDETLELHIYVKDNYVKRAALRDLLPEVKVFDKTEVKIFVEDEPNRRGGPNFKPEVVEAAFKGNPLYKYMHIWNDPTATNNPFCWVELKKTVIQYPNDDLNSLYGDRSCLPEDLAKEVLGDYTDHIFYDTVNPDRPIPEGDEDEDHGPFGKNNTEVKIKAKDEEIKLLKKEIKKLNRQKKFILDSLNEDGSIKCLSLSPECTRFKSCFDCLKERLNEIKK